MKKYLKCPALVQGQPEVMQAHLDNYEAQRASRIRAQFHGPLSCPANSTLAFPAIGHIYRNVAFFPEHQGTFGGSLSLVCVELEPREMDALGLLQHNEEMMFMREITVLRHTIWNTLPHELIRGLGLEAWRESRISPMGWHEDTVFVAVSGGRRRRRREVFYSRVPFATWTKMGDVGDGSEAAAGGAAELCAPGLDAFGFVTVDLRGGGERVRARGGAGADRRRSVLSIRSYRTSACSNFPVGLI